MRPIGVQAVVSVFLLGTTVAVLAEDLGTRANVYRIDPDGREQLKDLARKKQKSGELDKFWSDYRNKVVDAVKNPAPLGVKSSYARRSELRELKFVMPATYQDHTGKVIVRKGSVVEPLKIAPLKMGLLFIDGRDPKQVDYAIAKGRSEPLKIVLTAGSPFHLRNKYKDAAWMGGRGIPFYFDQRKIIIGTLANLYGIDISSVPSLLVQKGDRLAVEFGLPGAAP